MTTRCSEDVVPITDFKLNPDRVFSHAARVGRPVLLTGTSGIRIKNPAHPGGFVKSEIIEALDLTVIEAAQALGVTRPALSALVNERCKGPPPTIVPNPST